MTPIILVRHARPAVRAGVPAAEWSLTDEGRRDAVAMARAFDGETVSAVWSSGERKSCETAKLAFPGATIRCRDQLNEVSRPWYAQPRALSEATAAYVRGHDVVGWEPHGQVADRVESLRPELQVSEGAVIVSHGVLLTALVGLEVGLDDPFAFWSGLRMPDAWELDIESKSLKRIADWCVDV